MTRLGFELNSPVGRLYKTVTQDLKQQGLTDEILNKGFYGNEELQNDPEEIEPQEILNYVYLHPRYYKMLHDLGIPNPFALDDFNPETKEDEEIRKKFAEVVVEAKEEASKEASIKNDPKAFLNIFKKKFVEKSQSRLFDTRDPAARHHTAREMLSQKIEWGYPSAVIFLSALQMIGLEEAFHEEELRPKPGIKVFVGAYDMTPLWKTFALYNIPEEFEKELEASERHFIEPFELVFQWSGFRYEKLLREKKFEEASGFVQQWIAVLPEVKSLWLFLGYAAGRGGDQKTYKYVEKEFEKRYKDQKDYPIKKANLTLSRLQWEWDQGEIWEGELTAILKKYDESLEELKKKDPEAYLDNLYYVAERVWEFSKRVPQDEQNPRKTELKRIVQAKSFDYLLRLAREKPNALSEWIWVFKMIEELIAFRNKMVAHLLAKGKTLDVQDALSIQKFEKVGEDWLGKLSQVLQGLTLKFPENKFFLYLFCKVLVKKLSIFPQGPQEEKELLKSQMSALEKAGEKESAVMDISSYFHFQVERDYENALRSALKLVDLAPQKERLGPMAFYHLALFHFGVDEREKGREILKEVLSRREEDTLKAVYNELKNFSWNLEPDISPEDLKKAALIIEGMTETLEEIFGPSSTWDELKAGMVVNYWRLSDGEGAQRVGNRKFDEENFVNKLMERIEPLVAAIHLEKSTPRRLEQLESLLQGIQSELLRRHPRNKNLKNIYQTGLAVFLSEALMLNDWERGKRSLARIIEFDANILLVANRAIFEKLEISKEKEEMDKAFIFYEKIHHQREKLPLALRAILEEAFLKAGAYFQEAGEGEKALRLKKMGE